MGLLTHRPAIVNRSMPRATIIPELAYPDMGEAVDWLCAAFGFALRLRIGGHRAQLTFGDGAIVVTQLRGQPALNGAGHALMVRVDDVVAHHARAERLGVPMLRLPADYPFGERQYTCLDLGNHVWTFSQSLVDVAPETWGGTMVAPR